MAGEKNTERNQDKKYRMNKYKTYNDKTYKTMRSTNQNREQQQSSEGFSDLFNWNFCILKFSFLSPLEV